ncbi:dolichol-phosphate mannosyltransferase [Haematococcus lacustris]
MHLSVIIPTYNERDNIVLLLWLLREYLKDQPGPDGRQLEWEVVVVDDGSPDGTTSVVWALIEAGATIACNVKLVRRSKKLGLGSAYGAGLQEATGDWVVLLDGDFSHHPRYIPRMLAKQAATGCDIVSGTRYAPGGGVAGWTLMRKVISRGANLLASTLLGAQTSDLTGAFRLYRRPVLQRLLEQCTCRGYAFQMEVVIRAERSKCSVTELPIIFVDRLYGTSKLGAGEFLGFIRGLGMLWRTL